MKQAILEGGGAVNCVGVRRPLEIPTVVEGVLSFEFVVLGSLGRCRRPLEEWRRLGRVGTAWPALVPLTSRGGCLGGAGRLLCQMSATGRGEPVLRPTFAGGVGASQAAPLAAVVRLVLGGLDSALELCLALLAASRRGTPASPSACCMLSIHPPSESIPPLACLGSVS